MTNFERLINDKKKLAELLGGNRDFLEGEIDHKWCHKACPYKDRVAEHEDPHFCCPVSDAEIVEWWFEQEVTN